METRKDVELGASWTWSTLPDVLPAGTVVTMTYSVEDRSQALTDRALEVRKANYSEDCLWSVTGYWSYTDRPPDSFGAEPFYVYEKDPWGIVHPEELCTLPRGGPKAGQLSFRVGDGTRGETHMEIGVACTFTGMKFGYSYRYELQP